MRSSGSTDNVSGSGTWCHVRFWVVLFLWVFFVAVLVPVLGFGSFTAYRGHEEYRGCTFILHLVALGGGVVIRQVMVPGREER